MVRSGALPIKWSLFVGFRQGICGAESMAGGSESPMFLAEDAMDIFAHPGPLLVLGTLIVVGAMDEERENIGGTRTRGSRWRSNPGLISVTPFGVLRTRFVWLPWVPPTAIHVAALRAARKILNRRSVAKNLRCFPRGRSAILKRKWSFRLLSPALSSYWGR
jgi:hypothetical protein